MKACYLKSFWRLGAGWPAALLALTLLGMPAGLARAQDGTNAPVLTLSQVDVLDDKYKLVIGDQLSYRVIEDEDDPVALLVTDSGEIQVPYLGRYPAEGKTCKELAAAIKTELEKNYYKQASVIVAVNAKPRSRGKVYLFGSVRAPGSLEISSDEKLTVSRAILRAGGFTDFANQKKVEIARVDGNGKSTTITVDVSRILGKPGDLASDVVLQPEDLITVSDRMIRF